MTTEQNENLAKLSPTARRLVDQRDSVLEVWSDRIRKEMPSARKMDQPILVNTIPVLLEYIAEILSPEFPRNDKTPLSNLAQEHGSERARLTQYGPEDVIQEFQILRWAIVEVLEREERLSSEELRIVFEAIDRSVRHSVTTFALVQAEIRERFVATLTHDIRNPLGAAGMAAQSIIHRSDDPAIKALGVRLLENHRRIDRMIQDLLDATLVKSGGQLTLRYSEFEIGMLVGGVIEEMATVHGDRFKADFRSSVVGHWDADALKRALENMISNAVKYGDPNTPITVSVEAVHGRMILSVHNDGPAIPFDEQETVFQVFRRALAAKEGKKTGWGLGLPFVRVVAEAHGGSIGVVSADLRGTTFTIDIPVDARPYAGAPTL